MFPLSSWHYAKKGYRFGDPTFYNDFHIGVDHIVPQLTEVYAPCDGFVSTYVGFQGGKTVAFKTKFETRFLHLDAFGKVGEVRGGDVIGYTGNTGQTTTRAHCHTDVSRGVVDLQNRENFIDPELFYKHVKVAVICDDDYDIDLAYDTLAPLGMFLDIQKFVVRFEPRWVQEDSGTWRIDEEWVDTHLAHRGVGYDFLVIMTKDWRGKKTLGYARTGGQRLGNWRAYVGVNAGKRKSASNLPGEQHVATLMHEISHLKHAACAQKDRTHELDYNGRATEISWELTENFRGWDIDGATRLFKRKKDKIVERVVRQRLIDRFALKTKYWQLFNYFKEY